MGKKVYVVLAEAPIGDVVLGVFSTRKRAEDAAQGRYDIAEFELDAELAEWFDDDLE